MQFSSVLGLTSLHKCHVNTKAEITTHSFEVLNGIFFYSWIKPKFVLTYGVQFPVQSIMKIPLFVKLSTNGTYTEMKHSALAMLNTTGF